MTIMMITTMIMRKMTTPTIAPIAPELLPLLLPSLTGGIFAIIEVLVASGVSVNVEI